MPKTVRELRHLAENKSDILLFNPLLKDFSVKLVGFDEVILKANEITSIDGRIADKVKNKLITFIINERELDPISVAAKEIPKEIEVNI